MNPLHFSAAPSPQAAPVPGAVPATNEHKRILLLGLGNDILCDDAIGLLVTQEVRRQLIDEDSIEALETSEMGLSLLDFITGYEQLVIVDAIQTGKVPPGHLHEVDGDLLKQLPRISPHFLGVGEILALGRELGLAMPLRVKIFAIEVEDPFTLGTQLSPGVKAALPGTVVRVLAAVRALAAG